LTRGSLAVDGQILLSPFFKGASWQQTWAGATTAKGFLAILKSVFRLKKVSLSRVDRISRGKYRDLDILLNDPDTYDQAFSLRAGMNILTLTRALKSIRNKVQSDIPTSVAVSAADQTISWKYALKFSKRHFSELQDTLVLPKEEMTPHEIVVPDESLNKAFDRVAEWVLEQLLLMMEQQ
jgi:alpha-beta hydrolase superfamily lysophospholipase